MPSNYTAIPLDEPASFPSRSPRLSSAGGLPLPVTAGAPSFTSSSSAAHTAAPPSYPPPPNRRTLKGKGKATDQSSPHDDESRLEGAEEGPAGMSFSIRFTDGSEDLLDFWCGSQESVGEVKRRLRFLRPSLNVDDRPRRLRLIQLGRLLTNGTYLVPYTVQLLSRRAKVLREETQPNREAFFEGLEAVGREMGVNVRDEKGKEEVKGKGKGKEKDGGGLQGTEAEEDNTVWLHCSVGEPMDDEEIEGEKEKIQTTQITPLQGLDRLRDAGFSEEDIASMRAEFRRNAGATIDGDDDEHARALEDQWMEGLTGQNEAAVDTSASDRYWTTMLSGVCIGFFVPFLPFFFFRSQIFSRTMSMAIVLGAFINVGFGLLRIFS